MKPINILLILSLLLLGSCVDKDLNNDPTKSANLNPNFQLTGIELRQWGSMDIGSICNRYMSPLTQQMQGNWDATNYGGQYRNDDNQTHNLEVPGLSPGWSTLKIKHLQSFCRCFFFYR